MKIENLKLKISRKPIILGLGIAIVLIGVGTVLGLNGFFGGGGTIPEDTMSRGLVGYWGFDEGTGYTAYDAGTNNNNGKLYGYAGCASGDTDNGDGTCTHTWQVAASADDCARTYITTSYWSKITTYFYAGYDNNSNQDFGSAARFLNVTIPAGSTITLANLIVTCKQVTSATAVNTRLRAQADINPATFSDAADFDARTWTTAYVNWDAIPAWTLGTEYTSPDIKAAIQEVINLANWASGNPLTILWDDFQKRSTQVSGTERLSYSYDGSTTTAPKLVITYTPPTTTPPPTWTAGKVGGALQFDGVNDYVNVANSTSLGITSEITLEAWVKRGSRVTWAPIVDKWGTNKEQYAIYIRGDDNSVNFAVTENGNDTDRADQRSTYTVPEGVWVHIVGTFNTANQDMKIYINGSETTYQARPYSSNITSIFTSDQPLYVADWGTNPQTYNFNGLIDEVRIYNRALSAEEIRYHYNRGGPVGYWKFDEGTGQTAFDTTDNNNDGQLGSTTAADAADPTWSAGKYGTALSFDGVDDYVKIPTTTNSVLDITSAITVEAWAKASPSLPITQTWQVGASSDDTLVGWSGSAWAFSLTATYPGVGYYDTNDYKMGMGTRFLNVTIPPGSTIDTSYLILTSSESRSGTTVRTHLTGEKALNATTFSTLADYQARRGTQVGGADDNNRTVAQVAWDGIGGQTLDVEYNTPEIKTIIQEILNQGGWASGNAVVLFFDDHASRSTNNTPRPVRYFYSYDLSTTKAPKLVVTYTPPKTIVSKGNNSYALKMSADGSTLYGYINSTAITASVSTPTNWHHYVLTYDGANQKLYIDGVQASSSALTGAIATNATNLKVGDLFSGPIDEVRIYNYARTPEEIALDYNGGFAAHFGPSSSCDDDPGACMTQGLAGYWSMDEGTGQTAWDSSGSNNNGTLGTGPSVDVSDPAWAQQGKVGGALQFDGVNDYVDCGNGASLTLTNLTVEAWVKDINNASGRRIVAKADSNKWDWILGVNSGVPFMRAMESNSSEIASANAITNIITVGGWHHIVATLEGNTKVQIFVDGILEGTDTTFSGSRTVQDGTVRIALDYPVVGNYTSGLIDEVRIYNRALSATEVRYHYNCGGPVGYWKFDEGTGQTAFDSSGLGNNGQLGSTTAADVGDPVWTSGKYGSALSFDGVDDYVNCGTSTSLNPGTGNWSDEAWFKTSSSVGTQWIVQHYRDNDGDGWFLYISNTGKVGGVFYDIEKGYPAGFVITASPLSYNDNQWHHAVSVWSKPNALLYVDGNLVNTVQNTNIADMGTIDPGSIGRNTNDNIYFSGTIDDVRIYNYARTPEEIRLDYNAGFAALFGPQSSCDDDPGSCMTQGLAGYWSMDEGTGQTAYDQSGYNSNGILGAATSTGTDDPQWTTQGKYGGALQFDGANDYVNAGSGASLDITGAITIEAWVKFNARSSSYKYVLGKLNAYELMVVPDGEYGGIWFFLNGSGQYSTKYYITINPGTWYHIVALTTNGTTEGVKFYVNGQDIGMNVGVSGSLPSNANPVRIGYRQGNLFPLNGLIDEVKIFNRTLSAAEVRYHYNRGGPVAYWKFDEGIGQTAFDESLNNNDGRLGSTTAVDAGDPTWVAGKYGSALSFDGVNDYVDIGNTSQTAYTFSLWLNPNDTVSKSSEAEMPLRLNSSYRYNGMVFGSWTSYLANEIISMASGGPADSLRTGWVGNDILSANTWYYIVFVWNSTESHYDIYVNGDKKNAVSSASGHASLLSANQVEISNNYSGLFFNGLIDDVRIYNYARTQAQILQDYNAGYSTYFK